MTKQRSNSQPTGRNGRRRGYVSILALMLIVIGVVTLMLVVNWTFLVLASRRTLQLTDTLALSAVAELLDDDKLLRPSLQPAPGVTQDDDVLDAEEIITLPTTGFLARNNAGLSERFRPQVSELTIAAGYVDDASQSVTGGNALETSPGAGEKYNSLRVEVLRDPNGLTPVYLLMRGFGSPDTAKITGSSIATLDSRVVGYRPRTNAPSPVAPLAILDLDWTAREIEPGLDSNGNHRLEIDVVLKSTSGGGPSNGVLFNPDSTAGGVSAADIPGQVTSGLLPVDVDPSGIFGPLAPTAPLFTAATDTSPGNVAAIASAFDNLTLPGNDSRRVFPLFRSYSTMSGDAELIGFVACDVLGADAIGSRLRVRLEPTFIVHFTAETRRTFPGATSVPENVYVHKIRLTR